MLLHTSAGQRFASQIQYFKDERIQAICENVKQLPTFENKHLVNLNAIETLISENNPLGKVMLATVTVENFYQWYSSNQSEQLFTNFIETKKDNKVDIVNTFLTLDNPPESILNLIEECVDPIDFKRLAISKLIIQNTGNQELLRYQVKHIKITDASSLVVSLIENEKSNRFLEILKINPDLYQDFSFELLKYANHVETKYRKQEPFLSDLKTSLLEKVQNNDIPFVQGKFKRQMIDNSIDEKLKSKVGIFIKQLLSVTKYYSQAVILSSLVLKIIFPRYELGMNNVVYPPVDQLSYPIYVEQNMEIWKKLDYCKSLVFDVVYFLSNADLENETPDQKLQLWRNLGYFYRALICNCMYHWRSTPRHLIKYRSEVDEEYLRVSKSSILLSCSPERNFGPGLFFLWEEILEKLDPFEIFTVLEALYYFLSDETGYKHFISHPSVDEHDIEVTEKIDGRCWGNFVAREAYLKKLKNIMIDKPTVFNESANWFIAL